MFVNVISNGIFPKNNHHSTLGERRTYCRHYKVLDRAIAVLVKPKAESHRAIRRGITLTTTP